MLRIILLLGLALHAMFPTLSHAQTDTLYEVTGHVLDAESMPYKHLEVSIFQLGRNTFTDDQGQFTFHHVPNGVYALVFLHPYGDPKMQEIVGQKHPGDTIQIVFRREGEQQNTDVILKNVKNNTQLISFRKDKMLRDIGIHVRDLYSEEGKTIGQNNGAKVLTIFMGSPIDQQTDMVPGFVITGINGHPVQNANDVAKHIKEAGKKITFEGRYENHRRHFTYTVYR